MKVVDVAEFYALQGGGVKTYIHEKFRAAQRLGHELVVVAPGPRDGEDVVEGGRIVWIAGPPMPFDPRYFILWNEAAVHRVLDREAPDVVEGSSPWSGGWFAARWKGDAVKAFIFHQDPVAVYPETFLDRVVARPRINGMFRPFWGYLSRLSAHYDLTVTSGAWLARKLEGQGLRNPVAVPFGINRSRFSPSHADGETRARLLARCGAPADARLVVCVSRMHPEKRLGTVLEAFAQASKRMPMALVHYGDGPLRGWLERRAAAVPHVWLAGYTSEPGELPRVLASADAMLHGSAAETYGLVIGEALCSGTPVVVPDVGGAADLAEPGYAEVYPPGDAAAAAEALVRLLGRDRETLRRAALDGASRRVSTMTDHFDLLFSTYQARVDARGGAHGR